MNKIKIFFVLIFSSGFMWGMKGFLPATKFKWKHAWNVFPKPNPDGKKYLNDNEKKRLDTEYCWLILSLDESVKNKLKNALACEMRKEMSEKFPKIKYSDEDPYFYLVAKNMFWRKLSEGWVDRWCKENGIKTEKKNGATMSDSAEKEINMGEGFLRII